MMAIQWPKVNTVPFYTLYLFYTPEQVAEHFFATREEAVDAQQRVEYEDGIPCYLVEDSFDEPA